MSDDNKLFNQSIEPITIKAEMEQSYLTYAMSVIVSRALPDVRDGLKPVHRRILYAQNVLSNNWNRAYKKSARVVGDVIGKYHPHGDSAVYEALVRMAQDFSMRVPLEDGQGNFGSMDGDAPAAMRYTEVRMAKITESMLTDIDKDTVDFAPNYDGQDMEPTVLPARFPNVLVNGSSGIAVGMATNIPPHNLGEVIDGTLHLVDNPQATQEDIDQFILGPDFPTGGFIVGKAAITRGSLTGRGSIIMRSKHHIEKLTESKDAIIITEIPYQVNKAKLVERIAFLVKERLVEDISDLRDESDRKGVRVVIELKRGAVAEVILNQLYKHTPLQTSFGYNMLALDHNRPKLMGVIEILRCFLAHREVVINRRTRFELGKARDRAHILAGLATAVANIDEIIKIVRNAPNPQDAKAKLLDKPWPAKNIQPLIELLGEVMEGDNYRLSVKQAQAILDLRLHRLTGMEREKIQDEANEIQATIQGLVDILSHRHVMLDVLKKEMIEVKEQFSTPRKTQIIEGDSEVNLEDLIQPEDMVVTISSDGYVKRQPMATYRAQRRGGKGRSVTNLKGEETMANMFVANTHDLVFFFSSKGQVYKLKVYELPQSGTNSRGKAFVNLLPLSKEEKIMRVVAVPTDKETWETMSLMFATKLGMIRRTPLASFNNVRAGGIHGMGLRDGDELVEVHICPDDRGDVLISSKNGQAVRFPTEALRPVASRTGLGVKGMNLKHDDEVMSMHLIQPDQATHILSVTQRGFGKLSPVDDYPIKSRGTLGVISIKTTKRNGPVVSVLAVNMDDEIMIATADGQIIRTKVANISIMGRNTQGVKLFTVEKEANVSLVTRIPSDMIDGDAAADDEEAVEATPDMLAAVDAKDAKPVIK